MIYFDWQPVRKEAGVQVYTWSPAVHQLELLPGVAQDLDNTYLDRVVSVSAPVEVEIASVAPQVNPSFAPEDLWL